LSESSFPPFLKWGKYKSEDESNPDKLHIEVTDLETFETEYGVNVNAIVDGQEMAIPIQNFNSLNMSLLKIWNSNIRKGKIKKGGKFTLLTWMGLSKNARKIRRWIVEFNS